MRHIYFRADSSSLIGTGHVMRCITLAKALAKCSDVSIKFICRELAGNINYLIEQNGFDLAAIDYQGDFDEIHDAQRTLAALGGIESQDAPWLILDHYQIDNGWISQIDRQPIRLMAIDDLANRALDVSLMLNQNLLPDLDELYKPLVGEHCRLFLGPEYALLREEFYSSKTTANEKASIFVFFGGADHTAETLKILPVLGRLSTHFPVDIITGASNVNNKAIETAVASNQRIQHYCQVDNISTFMSKALFAIGAGGATCLERTFFCLPSITIITAENQLVATQYYQSNELLINLGWYHQVCAQDVYQASMELIKQPKILSKLSANMQKIAVGSKGAQYVAESILKA